MEHWGVGHMTYTLSMHCVGVEHEHVNALVLLSMHCSDGWRFWWRRIWGGSQCILALGDVADLGVMASVVLFNYFGVG